MQLTTRLSYIVASFLCVTHLGAENYVNVQFIGYDEDSGRTTVLTPQVEVNYDYGADYTLNMSFGVDSISGASPTFYDATSGASAGSRGTTTQQNVRYGDVSYDDVRKFVAASVVKRLESRDEVTMGLNYSSELDYYAGEVSAEYMHYLDNSKNSAVSLGAAYQKNAVLVHCYNSESQCDAASGSSQRFDIDVVNAELGFTQVIDKNSLVKVSLFGGREEGFLSNPYMNVVRNYNTTPHITAEQKPDTRTSYGATLWYARAVTEKLALIGDYRYYKDDWEIDSHTVNLEANYDLNSRWGVGAGVRYYTQSAAKFYNAEKEFFSAQKYASSDRRMSDFYAFTYKFSAEYAFSKVLQLNTGVTYYNQPDWFDAIYYTIGVKRSF